MKRVRGSTRARLPSYTDIFESEKRVVSAMEKKVIEMPLKSIAMKNRMLSFPVMKSMNRKVMVSSRDISVTKIICVMK